jgi:beta-N-acetylhexosaminidase
VAYVNRSGLTRRQTLTAIGLATAAGAAGCGGTSSPTTTGTSTARPTVPVTPSKSRLDEAALRRKIASLLVVGFRGQTVGPNDWIVHAIQAGLGGVILFDRDQLTNAPRNITSPKQVTSLIATLRKAAPSGQLIVSIDQEGGRIARLNPSNGFPASLSEAQVGAANSLATTRTWAQGLVGSMRSIGVNLNYAPVVDMNINPHNPAIGALGRSFSSNANVVVANASEEIKVHRSAAIKTTLKHFPGFGSATGNTDFGVVDVSKTWRSSELVPYQQLIAAGLADSVLVAHLLNRQLDPSLPASLSRNVVNGLLRGRLRWTGPVVSDDMQAVAITSKYRASAATAMALSAGVDLLVYANQQAYNAHVFDETLDTVVGLVRNGHLTEAAIDQAVARVDRLRPAK